MKTNQSRGAGRTVTGWMLSVTLATAGLGLTAGSAAWAAETAPAAAAASTTADHTAGATTQATTTTAEAATTTPAPAEPAAPQVAAVADVTPVSVSVTNETAAAAQLLEQINAERAAAGLGALTQDGTLTTTAWQRAAESVLLDAKGVRPDGSAVSGEELGSGADAQAALAALKGGSALTSATAKSVGVALVKDAAGVGHWAVEVSDAASTSTAAGVADGAATYTVSVPASFVKLSAEAQSVQVAVGGTASLAPKATVSGTLALVDGGASPYAFDASQVVSLPASAVSAWASSDEAAAKVSAGTLTGVADGTAQVSATTTLGTAAWNVTVGTGVAATPQQQPSEQPSAGDSAAAEPEAGAGSTQTAPEEQAPEQAAPEQTAPAESAPADTPATDEQTPAESEKSEEAAPEQPTAGSSASDAADSSSSEKAQIDLEKNYQVTGITTVPAGTAPEAVSFTVSKKADSAEAGAPATLDPSQYEASFTGLDKKGTATLTVKPKDGSGLTGSITYTFEVTDASGSTAEHISVADVTVTFDGEQVQLSDGKGTLPEQSYTGSPVEPKVTLTYGEQTLKEGTDYAVTYANNTGKADEDTEATLTITGAGIYDGTATLTFKIAKAAPTDLKDAGATIEKIGTQSYTGKAVEPDVVVKTKEGATLTKGEAYTVSYANNTGVGTGTVTVTGIGAYTGTLTADFAIAADVSDATVTGLDNLFYDNGNAVTSKSLKVSLGATTLVAGTDYTAEYADNVNAGTATVTITGAGSYTGTKTVEFTIAPKSIKGATVSAADATGLTFTGSAIAPAVTVKDGDAELKQGSDYELSYANNTNAGTATITVSGKGNYRDSLNATFPIAQASLTQVEVVMPNQYATGSALTPKPVSVKLGDYELTEGVDYQISGYANNTAVGKASATLTGIGNFTGSVNAAFEIKTKPGNVDASAANDAGNTQTLPKTGDATSALPVVVAAAAGVALVGAGAGIVVARRRSARRNG